MDEESEDGFWMPLGKGERKCSSYLCGRRFKEVEGYKGPMGFIHCSRECYERFQEINSIERKVIGIS